MNLPVFRSSDLTPDGEPIAVGGRGVIYRVKLVKDTADFEDGHEFLLKVYKRDVLAKNGMAMNHHLDLVNRLLTSNSGFFDSRLARPLAVVHKNGQFVGYVMKPFQDGCTFDLKHFNGSKSVALKDFKIFLNSSAERARMGVPDLTTKEKLLLLEDFLGTLQKLHALEIIVGVISGNNLVMQSKRNGQNRLRAIFLDVDSFRASSKPNPLGSEVTPDWSVPEDKEKNRVQANKKTDVYKAALMVRRLLHQVEENTEHSYTLRKSVNTRDFLVSAGGKKLLKTIDACFSNPPITRPTALTLYEHFCDFNRRYIE